MEHLLLKAAVAAATDQGTFEAVISTATPDRDGDIVAPSAMVAALEKWAAVDKLVPLAWAHTDMVVGHIDPATVRVDGDEVIAKGFIDQSTDRGAEAWRLVKSGTLSFSFGYLIPKGGATKRPGGRFHITTLDVFEISVVPVGPANNDTRVLNWKAAAEHLGEAELVDAAEGLLRTALERLATTDLPQDTKDTLTVKAQRMLGVQPAEPADKEPPAARSVDPLKEAAMKSALEVLTGGAKPPQVVAKEKPKQVPDTDPEDLRRRSRDLMLTVLTGIEVTT